MQKFITAAAVGLAATALAVNPTVGHLITGHSIKNGSITSADIKDHSLRLRDFRDPQLLKGQAGPPGTPGVAGVDAGSRVRIVTWTVHYSSTGDTDPVVTTSESVPAGAQLAPVELKVTNTQNPPGDLVVVKAQVDDRTWGYPLAYWDSDATNSRSQVTGFVAPSALPLELYATATDNNGNAVAVDDFDATFTFAETDLSGAPAATIR